jgi:septal ring factor EnvC (AmiA/AmiB activator)
MNDWAGILTAAGGFLTVLFAGLRWLIRVYMVKVKEAEMARKAAFESELRRLNSEAKDLRDKIEEHTKRLDITDKSLSSILTTMDETRKSFSNIGHSLRAFVDENKSMHKKASERIDKMEVLVAHFGKVLIKK